MNKDEIKELLNSEEYDFLKTNKYLGNKVMLLALGGSKAYGTDLPTSDTDIRGIAINPSNQIYGLEKDFEQVVETNTDTTIYSLNKMVKLLVSCNPNTLEILGCRPEDYLYISELGQIVLDNKENFLSVKAIDTFGGYARAQFNRLEHGLLGNGENDEKKLEMLKHSLECSINAFNIKHKLQPINLNIEVLNEDEYIKLLNNKHKESLDRLESEYKENMSKATDESRKQSLTALYHNDLEKFEKKFEDNIKHPEDAVDDRIVMTGQFDRYSIGNVQSLLRELNTIKSEYGNINKRNTKKTEVKLAKHMMHLIRLYLMGIDINRYKLIKTYRDGKEHDLLMSIRNGDYMYHDGMRVRPEFYELLHDVQNEYEKSLNETVLPSEPNIEDLNEMLLEIYTKAYK